VRSKQEASEDINYFIVPFKEAVEMVLNAQITQAVSGTLIMRARFQLRDVRTA
jgi:hypothetical protein